MKVLLVRLSSMGDLIHTLPAIEDLAKNRPDIELHWLCEANFSDIARLHPFVKKVHEMKWRQWRKEISKTNTWYEIGRLKKNLRDEQFDLVLDSQGLFKSAIFAKLANSPISGLDFSSAREKWVSLFYHKTYTVSKDKNAVYRNRLLFSQVFNYSIPQKLSFGLKVPKLGKINELPENYYVALHATSRDSKLWPTENWIALLQKLYEDTGYIIYLPWGNGIEKQRAEKIVEQLPFARVCNKMSLLQASWLLDHAVGIIGVDTGLLHLANALDKPVVGIYTDTNPLKTGVQESDWAKNLGNINKIPTTDEVYKKFKQCISAKQYQGKMSG